MNDLSDHQFHNMNHTVHDQFSIDLPEPRDRKRFYGDLDLTRIIDQTIVQCPILLRGDIGWLFDPSIQRALKLNAYIFGEEKRDFGGLLALTHLMRSAHRVYNYKSAEGFERHSIAAAFVALNHDTVEDAYFKRTEETDIRVLRAVMNCWGGPEIERASIERDILAMTNSRGLNGKGGKQEQLTRIMGTDDPEKNYTPRLMVVRYEEQLDTLEGDYVNVLSMSNVDVNVIRRFASLGRLRLGNIEAMSGPIGRDEKKHYRNIVDTIELYANWQDQDKPVHPVTPGPTSLGGLNS